MASASADFVRFFRSWIAAPRRISAVAPSSRALGRLITSEIRPGNGPILELGPGTGVFTRALLERGIDERNLVLVELGAEFARLLRDRFPKARVISQDAAELAASGLFADGLAGAAISGLPLLSMPAATVEAIIGGTFACLRPGAALYQFTYGPRCPVPSAVMERLGLKADHIGRTLRNIPPASVYRISRKS